MSPSLLLTEVIENRIYVFRKRKAMLDRDLARLYGVETKRLKEAVRRNKNRFPEDFMFELSTVEFANWRSQFATSKSDRQGLRYKSLAFTEPGIAMLSSILNSEKAIAVNIQIIRTFISLRDMAVEHSDLRLRIDFLEKQYDEQFKIVFDALRKTIDDDSKKGEIGSTPNRKPSPRA